MFQRLGEIVVRHAAGVLVLWVILALGLLVFAPTFASRTSHGQFEFLPGDVPSLRGEALYRRAFRQGSSEATPENKTAPETEADTEDAESDAPGDDEGGAAGVQQDPLGSNIVLLLRRAGPLEPRDNEFLDDVLVPAVQRVADEARSEVRRETGGERAGPSIRAVWTSADPKLGPLLVSEDGHATMVVIELSTEFLDQTNRPLLSALQRLVEPDGPLAASVPVGLDLKISGSATVGRDMIVAETTSASRTETFTFVLVIAMLVLLYRAPILALAPLVTVGVAVLLTLRILALLADWGLVGLFAGLETYVRVVMYGAGVDYALFLMARYREELDGGKNYPDALAEAVGKIGPALATSAGTSIVGIAMMCLADFGKFRQAGMGISLGLAVVLCAALSFTPAVLALFERYAFWPRVRSESVPASAAAGRFLPGRSLWRRIRERRFLREFWRQMGARIEAAPASWLSAAFLAMLPFIAVSLLFINYLSYGLLTDLPQTEPSVVGAKAIQEHFPAGVTGPVTVLISDPKLADERADDVSRNLTDALTAQKGTLRIADIRSQAAPLGQSPQAAAYLAGLEEGGRGIINRRLLVKNRLRVQARRLYVSQAEGMEGEVIRLDLVFRDDPFDRESINLLDRAEASLRDALPPHLRESAEILMIGPTASIRDLKSVTDADSVRIRIGVSLAVYVIIVILLRRPRICLFLIASVVLSYLATVGMTFTAFYLMDPDGFAGLDWKVPIFLFTLLIALGEDYNILFMARVVEEQAEHGPLDGIAEALARTGSIISSCGVIMAGTFASLLFGTLTGMLQMGFALTVGVLLDTFLVRPVLVPAWLMLLHFWQQRDGWRARIASFLGADEF